MQPTPSEHRLHPVALLLTLGKHIKEAVFAIAGVLFASAGDGDVAGVPWQALLGVVALVLVIVPTVTHYLTYRYRFEHDELVIRWGWLQRGERHVPFARIQSLDAQEGLLHRLVGAVGVTLETGGGTEAEGKISAVSRRAFEVIREQVHQGRLHQPISSRPAEGTPAAEASTIAHLTSRETLLAGLVLGRGMLVIGAVLAVLVESGMLRPLLDLLLGGDASAGGRFSSVINQLEADNNMPGLVLFLAVSLAVFLLLVRGLASLMTIIRFHGHHLELVDGELRVSCGLVVRSNSTTPIHRIQSLTVTEGPWHRLVKRVTVQVATAGGLEANAQVASRETLAPFLRNADLGRLVAIALRGLAVPTDRWNIASQPAYRRAVIRQLIMWTVPVALGWYIGPALGIACSALAVLSLTAALMRVSHHRWLAFDGGVALRTGWLWRRTTLARHDRIQLALFTESPFDRRHGMAVVSVDTAGSQAPALDFELLTRDDALGLMAQLDAGIAGTEFIA